MPKARNAQGGEERRWNFDRTVNIPTLVTIAVAVVSATVALSQMYTGFETRLSAVEYTSSTNTRDIATLQQGLQAIRSDQTTQSTALRTELKGDLRDLKADMRDLLNAIEHKKGN